jgi:Putative transposase
VPQREGESRKGVAQYAGFSLHAGMGVEAEQREKLERLARYVSRGGVGGALTLTPQGHVRYRLKTPYRDGTTHIVLEPLDFVDCFQIRAVLRKLRAGRIAVSKVGT